MCKKKFRIYRKSSCGGISLIGILLEKIEWLEILYDLIEYEPEFNKLVPEHSYSSSTYLTFNVKDKGYLSVVTQGAPVTCATIELLSKTYVFDYIIRIGTTGSFRNFLDIGDIVIPSGAIVGEGTSKGYVPEGFPAIPDLRLANDLFNHFTMHNYKVYYGIIYTVDAAFSSSPFSSNLNYKLLEELNCLGVDMETSAYFNVCSVKKIPAASIQIVSDSPNYPDKNSTEIYINKVHNRIREILLSIFSFDSKIKEVSKC
jgi:uridine phosphorylase